jgi:ATP-binding cassette subfamily B protein
MQSHRWTFLGAIGFSFVSLIFQTVVPKILMNAINTITQGDEAAIRPIVITVLIIGVLAGITSYLSRRFLFTTAYNVESDLRNLMYEHLTWLSFSFYDRVQSGQLISRANSDIRSVQMYFTFAPQIIVQASIGVVAFGFMLSINAALALVAMITMPILYVVGVKMRQVMFPISWIIQARLADVASIVDENVNGVRVVKSFAQEGAEVNRLADAAERVAWAYTKDADIRGQWRRGCRTSPSWDSPSSCSRVGG